MKQLLIIIVCILLGASLYASVDTLYIRKQATTIGITTAHFCSFLPDSNFSRTNARLQVDSGDTLNLTIVNFDTLEHTFTIDGIIESGNTVPPSGMRTLQVAPLPDGTYRYYSSPAYGQYLGASGVLQVGYSQYRKYCWNLFELAPKVSDSIALAQSAGLPVDFLPAYFTINGNYYPGTATDSLTAISGALDDTLIISVVNSGNIANSIHFHGYHVEILNARKNTWQVGWSKDTIPVVQGESVTFRLVAFQVGLYPIHVHNLVATTTGGIYPGGQITTIDISP